MQLLEKVQKRSSDKKNITKSMFSPIKTTKQPYTPKQILDPINI